MENYLRGKLSILQSGADTRTAIGRIAYRYMRANPKREFGLRPWVDAGFRQHSSGLYDIDFDTKFPDCEIGTYAYAAAYLYAEADTTITVAAELMRGSEIWVNGVCVAKTTVDDELQPEKKNIVIEVQRGKNPVFIKAKKTPLGFGTGFGEGSIAWMPVYMYMPFAGYDGYLGFAYSKPGVYDRYPSPDSFPDIEGLCLRILWIRRSRQKLCFGKRVTYMLSPIWS